VPDAMILLAAVIASVAGMSWFALSLDAHWLQVHGNVPRGHQTARCLRVAGVFALLASLVLCLVVDHASMASLVWVMTLTAAALLVAFTLTWRAQWLRFLAPRIPRGQR